MQALKSVKTPNKLFLISIYSEPNGPHPERHHIRWGKPRRQNAYNGLRRQDHHLLQFSATKAPEKEYLDQLSRDEGKF